MAQVSISVADIQIGIEDEDASAKSLRKLALGIVVDLVDVFGIHPAEEEKDGAPRVGGCACLDDAEHRKKCGDD